MAQLVIALSFLLILALAARSIAHELTRPLTLYAACEDDVVFDALCDSRIAPVRLTSVRNGAITSRPMVPIHRPALHPTFAAAA